MASALKAMGLEGVSATLATSGIDRNVYRSGREYSWVEVSPVSDLNALSVLSPKKLVVTKDALDWLVACGIVEFGFSWWVKVSDYDTSKASQSAGLQLSPHQVIVRPLD